MINNLEQIEMLRERANVSYEEAREALEKSNNDLVEALIYLEKENKIKAPQHQAKATYGFLEALKRLVKNCHQIKFVIKKEETTAINLPLTIVLLVTVIVPPLTLTAILVALFTKHRIRFEKPGSEEMKINQTLDKISNAAAEVSNQVAEAINK